MTHDPFADFDGEIQRFLESVGIDPAIVKLEVPASREFGDRSTNVAFTLAKTRRQAPRQIAEGVAAAFAPEGYRLIERVDAAGNGFINFYLNYAAFVPHVLQAIQAAGQLFGRKPNVALERVVVEHTSVNPNKEWHIGHVRNAVLGDIVGRLLRLAGHEVEIQNYIDDTGLQAAQAVFGLCTYPEKRLPDEKYDHYSGRVYVKIAAELEDEKRLRQRLGELEAQELPSDMDGISEIESVRARLDNIERLKRGILRIMHALEAGEYHDIVEQILNAQLQTAFRLGIFYDLLNWESHLVQSHLFGDVMSILGKRPEVLRPQSGRYAGALIMETGQAVRPGEEPAAEVLIRSNGIPTYVGKDIAYHMWKFHLIPDKLCYVPYCNQPNNATLWSTSLEGSDRRQPAPDRVINLIAVNQSLAQAAVKEALRVAGFPEDADHLVHLGYGLVSTPEGRISGRKGTQVDGDRVIDEAVRVALERVQEKRSQDLSEDDMYAIAEAVGVGAVRYFMVQYNPLRDIVFDVKDVVSFDGNTGLYVQYAVVRTFAILRRAADMGIDTEGLEDADTSLLQHEQERLLALRMAHYPGVIATASRTLAVNLVAEFAFELATSFSQFYRDCGVLNAEPELRAARLLLVRTVRDVLINACNVLGVPVIERL